MNFDLLPMENVERVEILRGTASLLGPNSLGGAINLVTSAGPGGELTVETGSRGLAAGAARIGTTRGAWRFTASGGHETEDGWRDDMQSERSLVSARVEHLGTRAGVRLQVDAARSRAETAGSLPLSVYAVRPDSNLTAGDFEHLRQAQLAASGFIQAVGGVVSARAWGRFSDAERFNVNQQDDPDVRGFTGSRTFGGEADWRATRPIGASALLTMRVGAGTTANHTAIELFAERIEPGKTTDVESPIRRTDAFAIADLDIGPLTLNAGVRFDHVRVPFRNRLNPARDTTSTFEQWSPRAGAALRIADNTYVYASLGRGFRPPALIEIACADPDEPCPLPFALGDDPPIDPVRVTTREIGAAWANRFLRVDAAAFRSDVYDDIFLFPYEEEDEPTGSTIDGFFDNVPHTRREGFELSADVAIGPRIDAFATYAYTRATFRSDGIEIFSIREVAGVENEIETADRMPLVPDHTFTIGTTVQLTPLLDAGGTLHFVGERYLRGDEANDEDPLDPYARLDLRLGITRDRWRVNLALHNATNNRYAAFGTFNINQAEDRLERFLTPGEPRAFRVALSRLF